MRGAMSAAPSPPRRARPPATRWPRSPRSPLSALRHLTLAAAAALLLACGDSGEAEKLAAVERRLAADDVEGAIIEARNALQMHEKSAPARVWLARALLAAGDVSGAGIETERAATLGATPALLVPLRARLLLDERKPAEALRELEAATAADNKASAELQLLRAQAHRDLGDRDAAAEALAKALAAAPDHLGALVLKARLAGARGETGEARRLADQVLALDAQHAPGWVLKGDLLGRLANDVPGALQAYGRARELRPRLVAAHSGAIELLLRSGQADAAAEAATAMVRGLPGNGTAMYYQALVAFLQGRLVDARDITHQLVRGAPDQLAAVYLAGLVQARLGEQHQATAHLTKAVLLAPEAHEPRRELAAMQARAGQPREALDTLRPVLAAESKDPAVWTTAGRAHTELGDFAAADAAFARARRLAPGAGAVRVEVGRALIAKGQWDLGLRELQLAGDSEDAAVEATLAQAALHMRRGDAAAALKAVDIFAAKRPKAVLADLLRGRIRQARGDAAGARAAYEAALAKDARLSAAVSSLAELDLADDRLADARARHEALLKLDPRAATSMLALAAISRRAGGSRADAARWIDQAVRVAAADAGIWRQAIALHRREGDDAAALARAQTALAALPDHPELLADLAAVQLAGGESQQAVTHLLRLVHLVPNSADAHLRLAEALLAAGQRSDASDHVLRAYRLAPTWPPAVRASARMAALEGDARKASTIAQRLREQAPREALGWLAEAEFEIARGQWARALPLLREAHAVQPDTATAIALHRALARPDAGAPAAAAREFENTWLKARAADTTFLAYLGRAAAARGDYTAAAQRLKQAAAAEPRNALLLNDLAYAQVRAGDNAALGTAERAYKLAPYLPAVLDTLAAALAARGQPRPAAARQAEAVALAPKSVPMRLQLAQLLAQAGQADKAREEARRVLTMQPRDAERDAAQQLLARLGG